jgi:hypothetical protein
MVVWCIFDKKAQPRLYTSDLVEHNHVESTTPKVKKLIETERRSPGGSGTW